MELSEQTIQEVESEIYSIFEKIYEQYLQPKMKVDFKTYITPVLNDLWEEIENLMEVTNETLFPVMKRRQVTKKRWVKKELDEENTVGFASEIDVLAKMFYEQFKDTDIEKFRAVYHCDTFEELRERKIEELEKWCENDDALMCHYPYFKYKKPRQIESALVNDVQYLVIKRIKEKCPTGEGEQTAIVSLPNSMTKFPYDHTNRAKIKSEPYNGFFHDVYYIDDTTVLESYLNVEALQKGLMGQGLKILNSLDQRILIYLMSLKHQALYSQTEMVVEIGDIVRNVFDADGKKNYMAVKESLIKMDNLKLRIMDASMRTITVEIFFKVDIYVAEESKREVARIIFSEDLINEFVKKQTVSIYKRIIDNFTLNSSKILIYPLQRQRIACASQVEEGEPIIFRTNLAFFRGALYFDTTKRRKQIQTIEKALDEIVESNITLKSYQRKGDNFILEFYPFSEKEKRDLLNNNAPKQFLLNQSENKIVPISINSGS